MAISSSLRFIRVAAVALAAAGAMIPGSANSSASYGYDQLGRLNSALYDNGLCVAYVYDASGNRTSQTNTINDAPEDPVWGTGSWGCFKWTTQ